MKFELILSTLFLTLGTNNNLSNVNNNLKNAQNSNIITSFEDFIYSKDDLVSYYGNIDLLTGEDLVLELENVISKNNKKPNYDGNVPGINQKWASFYLLDRNYSLSPLTQIEQDRVNKNAPGWWNTSEVYCNVLYEPEPLNVVFSNLNKGPASTKISIDREHVYPKSYGFNGPSKEDYKDYMAGCDMHNLHMGESESNQQAHSDYVYGNVTSNKTSFYSKNTKKIGSYNGNHEGYSKTVFEPLDKDKGDIARSLLYMSTRYHSGVNDSLGKNPKLVLSNSPTKFKSTITPDETKNHNVSYGILDDILSWNTLDLVSEDEKIRNTLCQKYIQGNRNPFIDFPLWADVAFNENSKYYADIESENGVSLIFGPTNKDFIKESYGVGEKIDLTTLTFENFDGNKLNAVPKSDLTILLTNLTSSETSDITSNTSLELTKEGEYNLKVQSKSLKKAYEVKFKVGDLVPATFKGDLSNVFEGDTFNPTKFTLEYLDNGSIKTIPSENCSYYLLDSSNNESELTSSTILEKGKFKIKIKASYNEAKYEGVSDEFEVKPLIQSVVCSPNIKRIYKTTHAISLQNVMFNYIRNGETISVPSSNLTYTLTNKLTKKSLEIKDGYVFNEPGDYILNIETKVDEKYTINKEVEIEVQKAKFYEEANFQKLLFYIGLGVLALIIIILIIVIIKKSRKHK